MWDMRERKVKDDSKFLPQATRRMELPPTEKEKTVGSKELRGKSGVGF